MDYQTRDFLASVLTLVVVLGTATLLVSGGLKVLSKVNAHVEARCIAQGGQILKAPADLSRCLLPAP